MGNSLRCCLACVLPCGALDLIRIVHLNGFVEEVTRSVTAGEILKSYPNHVLSKPCSQGMVRKILILSPDSELKRGSIYFLIPDTSLPSNKSKPNKSHSSNKIKRDKVTHNTNKQHDHHVDNVVVSKPAKEVDVNNLDLSGLDLTKLDQQNVVVCEIITKPKSKVGKHQRRRSSRGKSGIWQPHLQSITEDL